MSHVDYLTVQILRGEITVEQARDILLDYHYRNARKPAVHSPETLAQIEDHAIADSMRRNDGNVDVVARELNMSRSTLYRRLR